MRQLPQNYPEIYDKFLKGLFVVKQSQGNFNAVADLKLEQTISRSQRSVDGIIGQTRQRAYVTKWEIVYHEILAISNTFRGLTHANLGSNETNVHQELNKNFCKSFNTDVNNVYSYFTEKGNP